MAYNVKFLKGTIDNYNGLASKDINTFYYIDGTDLYLGEIKLSNGVDLATAILRIAANETDIDNIQKELAALTGSDSGSSINEMITDAVDALRTELNAKIQANTDAIDAIEADYLKQADKTELSNAIAAEKTRAEGIEAGLESRLATVEGDYLVKADKTELEGKITAEQTRAEAAEKVNADAIAAVKEDVDAFFADATISEAAKDTLKEIQEYIDSDATAAAEMTASIKANADAIEAIEADYLKAADKTELQGNINTLSAEVDTKADTSTVTTLEGRVSANETAIAGKAAQTDLDTLAGRVTTAEGNISANTKAITDGDAATLTSAKEYADGLAGNYATKAQGQLAETALQAADITTGSANGTIAVEGTDVAVKGLGSAAYTNSSAYEVAGAAASALTEAKTYAESEADAAETAAKAYADGLATNYDAAGSASAAETNAKAYTDSALTWGTIA